MKRLMIGMAAILLVCVMSTSAWAQATAQISGTVRDQTGAVLPGVEVTATQTGTGVARNTITNETGTYVLPNLAIGPYRLEASLPGFRTFAQTGIVLQVNANAVINPTLEVGQVTEQVEVEANAALVETRSSTVGQVIENQRILDLPLNGRNVTDLITLAGAAVVNGSGGDSNGGGSFISISGGFSFGVDYSLDGANHRNFISGANMPMPFPDALQEFKVETSGSTGNQGRAAGVGAVTKSGTNEFHGDLFEFVRNDLFNARQYFATTQSTLKRHQFGGTIGGPIRQNKLFFFAGYQGTTIRQDPANNQAFMPTAAIMSGDWTAFTSPACNGGRQIALRAPFTGNRIDPAQYSRGAVNLANRLIASHPPTDACGLVTFGARTVRDEGQYISRVDYQMSANNAIFGRYMASTLDNPPPFTLDDTKLLNTTVRGFNNLVQSATIGDTYLIGPNTVNALRLAYNRSKSTTSGVNFFSACDLGVNIYCGYAPKRLGQLAVANTFTVGSNAGGDGQVYVGENYQISDDLSLVRGTHQFSFGGYGMMSRFDQTNHFVNAGTWNFNAQQTGLALGDFMLGRVNTLNQGNTGEHQIAQLSFAAYINDTWKASPKLTVNYGIRWEPYISQSVSNGRVYSFDINRFLAGTQSTVFVNAPAGFYYPGDPGFPGKKGVYNKWGLFAPRLGLAWDVNGDGRTSVRASYSYSYNFVSGQWRLDASSAAPWGNRTNVISPAGGFDDPWRGIGNPFPYTIDRNAPFAPTALFNSVRYDVKTPVTSAWNLSVERQIGTAWLASASYIGSQTAHMWTLRAQNPALFFPGGPCTLNGVTYNPCSTTGNTNQRRLFSILRPADGVKMSAVADTDDGGTMGYNGMLLSVQRRMSRGISASANYTWSHCIGDYVDLNSMGPQSDATYTNPNNRKADRGNCDTDRRHIFNFTTVAETPRFANPTARMIGTGWKLAVIYRRSAGSPLNITSGVDAALSGTLNQRPNQISSDVYTGDSGPNELYMKASAFAAPGTGTYGNLTRNAFRGPWTWSFDAALSRRFSFRETQDVEFRIEAFNVTNSFRPTNPGTAITGATFGQIRNSLDPRVMEFALKYAF